MGNNLRLSLPLFLALLLPAGADPTPGMERLVHNLAGDNPDDRETARDILRRSGPAAREALHTGLLAEDATIRRACVRVLAARAEPESVGPLRERLGDDDRVVRREAAAALAWIGRDHPSAREAFESVLLEAEPDVRERALGAFSENPYAIDETLLVAQLRDDSEAVRRVAAYAAARMARIEIPISPPARQALQDLVDAEETGTAVFAAAALAHAGGAEGIDYLLRQVDSRSPEERTWAILTLREVEPVRLDARLAEALGRTDAEDHLIRSDAARALRDARPLGIPQWEGLLARLEDPYEEVRVEAARTLRHHSRTSFGFQPSASVDERAEAVRRWKSWWEENKYFY